MTNEGDQLPGTLIVIHGVSKCRHSREPDAVLDGVIKLAIRLVLGERKPHIRRLWVKVAAHQCVSTPIVGMALCAVVCKMGARRCIDLCRWMNRIGHRLCLGRSSPATRGFR